MSTTEYSFDASVLGLGGYYVRDGRQTLIPSIASTVLASSGGEGWSSVTNYDTPDIGFTRAESRVRGYETSPGFFTTISDIYITNLRMFDRVRIALLQATVTSTRDLSIEGLDEAEFQLHAVYRGIDVDDEEIVPQIDIEVCQATYQHLRGRINAAVDANQSRSSGFDLPSGPLSDGDPIRSTIVHGLAHKGPFEARGRNELLVPGLAKLRFGELLAKRGRRKVSLLRLDFNPGPPPDVHPVPDEDARPVSRAFAAAAEGLSGSGSVTIASVGGNGEPIWPRG
jgi:hypothetical protein